MWVFKCPCRCAMRATRHYTYCFID
jgi:hypothetical protein